MENSKQEELRKLITAHKQQIIEFLQALVKTPSVNNVNKEKNIADLIVKKAKELGLPCELKALEKDRPNVFIGNNFDKKEGLLLIAHLDTVPAGDENNWEHPPFSAEIEGDKLFGRGAGDCKAGIALSLYALKILQDLGKLNSAKFVGVVDEERGADSKLGARFLLDEGLNGKAAIYTYPSIPTTETLAIGHRGLVRLWIEVIGESAHTGSQRWQDGTKGANAIEALVKFINSLSEVAMEGTHKDFPGYGFKQTVTLIEGGSGESMVPEKAKVLIDARLLPNQENEIYIQKIRQLTEKFNTDKIKFKVEIKTNVPGAVISPDESIVQILKKLDEEVMRIKPEVRGAGPANEGYMFIKNGIPTICGFGVGGDNVHAADEYIKLNTLDKILEIYIRAAIKLSSK